MAVKNNRILNYVLISLIAFGLSIGSISADVYENYYGIEMNNQEYNNLINLGFSEKEIYYMSLETFEENKDADSTLVSKVGKYYKTVYTDLDGNSYSTEVTKEEYDNHGTLNTRGIYESDYKYIVTTIAQNGNMFRYKISISWNRMPARRSYDIIGIGFDDNVYINSSVYFNYYMCDTSNNCGTYSYYYDKKVTDSGATTVFKFPDNARTFDGAMWYDVAKNTSSTITSLAMYGDYSHATSNISGSSAMNHNVSYNGILLGSSIYGAYDAIPVIDAYWNGSW